jgi:hypothetical protein
MQEKRKKMAREVIGAEIYQERIEKRVIEAKEKERQAKKIVRIYCYQE